MVNNAAFQLHLKILGPRSQYCLVSKNHQTRHVETVWLPKPEIYPYVEAKNKEGYTCWVSLNDKEQGRDTIRGVKTLCVLWFDVDSNRQDKSKLATKEELKEALEKAVELQKHLEKKFNAWGYIAYSGNGYHIFFPLPFFELLGEKFRQEINDKIRLFAKQIAANCSIEIDHVYDIRRVTATIGSLNLKIPDQPLQTSWSKEVFEDGLHIALRNVDKARESNQGLLEAILNTNIAKTPEATTQIKKHLNFEKLLERDEKLKDLYMGNWRKYSYKSRSEAEEALLVKLVGYGFSDSQIMEIMEGSQIGKWQERPDSYREHSLEKAREYEPKLRNYMLKRLRRRRRQFEEAVEML